MRLRYSVGLALLVLILVCLAELNASEARSAPAGPATRVAAVRTGTAHGPNSPDPPTPTFTGTPPTPCGTNSLQNGGFESGTLAGWTVTGATPAPTVVTAPVHTGTFAARLGTAGGGGPSGVSEIYQSFTVPAYSAVLSYWYWPATDAPCGWNWQESYITDASGTHIAPLMRQCQNTQTWTHVTYNLDQYVGQTIGIAFDVQQDGSGPSTVMYVDDVSVSQFLGCGITPTPIPSATPSPTAGPPTDTATASPTRPFGSPTPTFTGTPRTSTPTPSPCPACPTATATATATCVAAWVEVDSPNPGSAGSGLQAVTAAGPGDVWAVGSSLDENAANHTLIEHETGTGWVVVPSPDGPAGTGRLYSVAAAAPNDIWAVGSGGGAEGYQELIEHWDGSSWSLVPGPLAGAGVSLRAVAVAGPNDVWAAGFIAYGGPAQAVLEHWNGTAWSVVPSPEVPQSVLLGLTVIAPNDIWAVGDTYDNGDHTLAEHWNGTTWTVVPTPNVPNASNGLRAVAALAANNVWAAGYYFPGGVEHSLILHWDGSAWTRVAAPDAGIGTTELLSLAAGGPADLWAVGYSGPYPTYETFTLHWNGSNWAIVPSANRGPSNWLYGVTMGAGGVWAAGTFQDSSGATGTLVERYTGSCSTPTPTPAVSHTATPTRSPTTTRTPSPTVTGTPPTATNTPTPTSTATATHQPPPPTVTPTLPPPTGTAIPSRTATVPPTRTGTVAPTATGTVVPTQTVPATATPPPPTGTVVPTRTAPATATPPPATGTALPTRTAQPTGTATATPCGAGFTDVHPSDYFYGPVLGLACRGAISGYSDGSFRPFSLTTRAQMVKIVVLGLGLPLTTPAAGDYTFSDVPPAHPFFAYIETAAAHGIVSGYTCGGAGLPCDARQRPYFRPSSDVTRAQLTKITVGAAGWALNGATGPTFADVAPGSAFYLYVETAVCHGLISGYSCGGPGEPCDPQARPYFRQYNSATRGQIAKIVYGAAAGGPACGP